VQATWEQWRTAHADTTVLKKSAEVQGSHYQKYFDDPEKLGLFRAQWLAERMPGKTLVYGAAVGPHALAVTPVYWFAWSSFYPNTEVID
jgi:hypothetical protein